MKNDLATSTLEAIVGVVAAFFLVNMFFEEIQDVSISSVDPNLNINMAEPDPDIFNFLSINPTVEVYVGDCNEVNDETGECVEEESEDELNAEDQENF